jgi:hypothetical protein
MTRMTCRVLPDRFSALASVLAGSLLSWLLVGTAALLAGCHEPAINPVGDLGTGTPSDLAGQGPQAFIRLGHFIVGLAPFDICIKGPQDADFVGPLVRLQAQRNGGIPYASVSQYLTVGATTYSVRAVPGAATDCKTALGGVPDLSEPPLGVGNHYVVIASGDLARPATIKFGLIADDLSTQGGQARLRFINAAPDLASADLGFGSGAQYSAQIVGAQYGGFGLASGAEYLTTAPLANGTVAVRQAGMNVDALALANKVTLAAGTTATSVVEGIPGDKYTPLALVLCNDSAAAQGGFSSCTELP